MDWNGNGKQDSFDTFMDMKLMNGELDGKGTGNCTGSCLGYVFLLFFVIGAIVSLANMFV